MNAKRRDFVRAVHERVEMNTIRSFGGSSWLVALSVSLVVLSGCSVSVKRHTYTNEAQLIKIPVLDDLAAPEGKSLTALHYQVTEDNEVSLRRTLESSIGFLGCATTTIEEGSAKAGEEPYVGIRVTRVDAETPAARAGLWVDDVILEANGRPMSDPRRFSFLVRYHELEKPLKLRLSRAGEVLDFEVNLESTVAKTEDYELVRPKTTEDPHCGMVLGDLGGGLQKYFFEEGESGVIVLSITAGAPAFYSKARTGDIILGVGVEEKVRDSSELLGHFQRAANEGHELVLRVRRGEEELYAPMWPKKRVGREVSFSIPFVVSLKKRVTKTEFGMVLGSMLCGYERASYVDGSYHRQTRSWGALLNLIRYTGTPEKKTLRLLWLIKFNW